jgi:hypothetical protein
MSQYAQPAPNAPYPPDSFDPKAQAAAEKAYRKAQRPWFKKKRFIIPLALVVLIIIVQLGGDDETGESGEVAAPAADVSQEAADSAGAEETAPAEDAAAAEEAAPAEAEETAPAAAAAFPGAQESDIIGDAGQTLELDGVAVTVSPLTYSSDVLGEYLLADVTLVNSSDETVSYNAFEFELQNPAGSIESTTIGGTDAYLGSGDLVPGGSVSGVLPFEAMNGDEAGQFVVLYEPLSFFNVERAAWVNNR